MRQERFTLSASPLNSHGGSAAKKVPRAQESHQLRRLGVVDIRTFLDKFCLLKFSGGYFKQQSQFIAFEVRERKP